MHALRSHMSGLRFCAESHLVSLDDDLSDTAFVWAFKFVGGWDAVEEFMACGVYLLAAGVSFDQVSIDMTPVSKMKMPLPKFVVARKDGEDDIKFFAWVELDVKGIGSNYTPRSTTPVLLVYTMEVA